MPLKICYLAFTFCFLILIKPCIAETSKPWDGPQDGPPRQGDKNILFISQDFQNGGILGVYRGFSEAASELGWGVNLVNGKGSAKLIHEEFMEGLNKPIDAIVLGGFQAKDLKDLLPLAKKSKIILVGWHASALPGPTPDLFINITTSAAEVAKLAAEYVIQLGKEKVGVVIFNDNRFDIANTKTQVMKERIEQCKTCKVLSIENLEISLVTEDLPARVRYLNKTYGQAWTHTLAINDIYFDTINYPLAEVGRTDILNVSAGDGSSKALTRIKSGISQQVATVAEPLNLQGWQLADELNRAFAGNQPSGYISKPILVTKQLLIKDDVINIASDLNYKNTYTAIWQGLPITK